MSYDLMVYDPRIAFVGKADFIDWYDKQTKWSEDHGYNNSDIPTPELGKWFRDMIVKFPPMNGPLADKNRDDSYVTDYCLGKSLIYVAFAWSVSQEAHAYMQDLAAKHRLGFFDITAAEVWGISGNDYRLLFKT